MYYFRKFHSTPIKIRMKVQNTVDTDQHNHDGPAEECILVHIRNCNSQLYSHIAFDIFRSCLNTHLYLESK